MFKSPLTVKREGHWVEVALAPGKTLMAVGWLGTSVPCSGETDARCIEALWKAYGPTNIFSDSTLGWHDCEMCLAGGRHLPTDVVEPVAHWRGRELRLYGHGHYLVEHHDTVYMAPALLLHYILEHGYQPPPEFVTATVDGRLLTADDLVPT